jgi:hypothetical protein
VSGEVQPTVSKFAENTPLQVITKKFLSHRKKERFLGSGLHRANSGWMPPLNFVIVEA